MSIAYLVYCRTTSTYSYDGYSYDLDAVCRTKKIAEDYIKSQGYTPDVEEMEVTYYIEKWNVLDE